MHARLGKPSHACTHAHTNDGTHARARTCTRAHAQELKFAALCLPFGTPVRMSLHRSIPMSVQLSVRACLRPCLYTGLYTCLYTCLTGLYPCLLTCLCRNVGEHAHIHSYILDSLKCLYAFLYTGPCRHMSIQMSVQLSICTENQQCILIINDVSICAAINTNACTYSNGQHWGAAACVHTS